MRAIICFIVVFLVALPCHAQEAAKKEEVRDKTADYYPMKAGTKWHYIGELPNGRKFVFLTQIAWTKQVDGRPMARVETIVGGHLKSAEEIGIDAAGIFRYSEDGDAISPPAPLLKFPIKEDATWTTELNIRDKTAKMTGKTGKWEKVVVPAGTYRAIPVQIEMTVEDFHMQTTSWYAPGVGIVKQTVERQGQQVKRELSKYEAGH